MSVGNNFQGLSACRERLQPDQWSEITSLYENNFDAIFPRDPFSTEALKEFFSPKERSRIKPGLDAAFLLNDDYVIKQKTSRRKRRGYTFFFGRSGFRGITLLRHTLSLVSGKNSAELKGWFDIDPSGSGREQLGALIEVIKQSDFIITDTYHLCVNAMRLGVPVLGIGLDEKDQKGTLGDFKKAVLFSMFGRDAQYVSAKTKRLGLAEIKRSIYALGEARRRSEKDVDDLGKRILKFKRALKNEIFFLAGLTGPEGSFCCSERVGLNHPSQKR